MFHPLLPPPRRGVLAHFFGGFWPPVPCRAGRIASCCRRWEVPRGPALPHSARSTRLFHPLTRGPRMSRKSADFGCLFLRVWSDLGACGRIGLRLLTFELDFDFIVCLSVAARSERFHPLKIEGCRVLIFWPKSPLSALRPKPPSKWPLLRRKFRSRISPFCDLTGLAGGPAGGTSRA